MTIFLCLKDLEEEVFEIYEALLAFNEYLKPSMKRTITSLLFIYTLRPFGFVGQCSHGENVEIIVAIDYGVFS
jgi:hypothetical protein